MTSTIVAGYDGTPGARTAVVEAARLAARLGSELVIGFGYGTSPFGGGEDHDLRAAVRERGGALAAEAVALAGPAGVRARFELIDDRAAEGLARLAEELDAEMIVVGSYGETPMRGAILGSTPHRLLHLADRPVLVVRAEPG